MGVCSSANETSTGRPAAYRKSKVLSEWVREGSAFENYLQRKNFDKSLVNQTTSNHWRLLLSFTQVAVCLLSWSLEKIFVIIIIIMRALPLSYPRNLIAISDKKRSGRGFYRKFVYSSRAKGKRVLIL